MQGRQRVRKQFDGRQFGKELDFQRGNFCRGKVNTEHGSGAGQADVVGHDPSGILGLWLPAEMGHFFQKLTIWVTFLSDLHQGAEDVEDHGLNMHTIPFRYFHF